MSIKGIIVNRSELADFLGVSLPTIDAYLKRGCPYVSEADRAKGVPWGFNTADVVNWNKEDYRLQEGLTIFNEWAGVPK